VVRGHRSDGPRAKTTFSFLKNTDTQTIFSIYHGSVVVRDRETKFVSGPQVSQG